VLLFTGLRPQVEHTLPRLLIIEKVTEENCLETFNDAILRIEEIEQESSGKMKVDDEKLSKV